MQYQTLWQATSRFMKFPELKENIEADVCVIGAGISGLTTAYLLMEQGKRPVVIDAHDVVSGETPHTSAHLTCFPDYGLDELLQKHDLKKLKLLVESQFAAIDKIEEIVAKEKIECDFKRIDGYLYPVSDDEKMIDDNYDIAKKIGMPCELNKETTTAMSFLKTPYITFYDQAEFNPLKYLKGIINKLNENGIKIYSGTRVTNVTEETKIIVDTEKGQKILCDYAVIATNTPVNNRFKIHTKQAAYTTYIIVPEIIKDSVPEGLYWDTENPFHYVRVYKTPEKDYLIVGGEDHKTGQQEKDPAHAFRKLELWTRERFKSAGDIAFQWSGEVMNTIDGIGFIGKNTGNERVFIITGDCGTGLTNGTLGGMIISDLIEGKKNKFSKLYNPRRKTLSATGKFAEENINVLQQYINGYLSRRGSSEVEMQPDSGLVIRKKGKLIAAYKDRHEVIHNLSAVCTHMGCIVNWNSFEKTWDCPCHGSRFSASGDVIRGPAISPLESIGDTEEDSTDDRKNDSK